MKLRKLIYNSIKKIKYLEINFTKEMQNLSYGNYEALLKKLKI